mmetsp:Transcript_2629/g.6257  ORF Transcript_2629/g.6257 Transcript_2629/m.6257 type:complete len:136 (-) Transcript_2629:1872-2279(-)
MNIIFGPFSPPYQHRPDITSIIFILPSSQLSPVWSALVPTRASSFQLPLLLLALPVTSCLAQQIRTEKKETSRRAGIGESRRVRMRAASFGRSDELCAAPLSFEGRNPSSFFLPSVNESSCPRWPSLRGHGSQER